MNLPAFVRYQLPLLLWVLLIFGLSAIPSFPVIRFPLSPDKIVHAVIYFVLCMLAQRAFYHQGKWKVLRDHALLAALVFSVCYGILDEVHQMYVPHRSPDVYDAVADALGALLFIGMWWIMRRRKGKTVAGN